MSFFVLKLKGGETAKPSTRDGYILHLSHASIVNGVKRQRNTLSAKIGKDITTLAVLVGRVDNHFFDLFFDPLSVEFINEGAQEVHLSGYYEPEERLSSDADFPAAEADAEPPAKKQKTDKAHEAKKAETRTTTITPDDSCLIQQLREERVQSAQTERQLRALGAEYAYVQNRAAVGEDEVAKLHKVLAKQTTKLSDLQAERDATKEHYDQSRQAVQFLSTEVSSLKSELDKLQKTYAALLEAHEVLQKLEDSQTGQTQLLEQKTTAEREKREEVEKELAAKNSLLKKQTARIDALERFKQEVEKELAAKNSLLKKQTARIDALERFKKEVEKKLAAKNSLLKQKTARIEALERFKKGSAEHLNQYYEDNVHLSQQHEDMVTKLAAAKAALQEMETKMTALQDDLARSKKVEQLDEANAHAVWENDEQKIQALQKIEPDDAEQKNKRCKKDEARSTSPPMPQSINDLRNAKLWCNVNGCAKRLVRKVTKRDKFGRAGPRCMKHGGRVARCNVRGCRNYRVGKVATADGEGPSGYRCLEHGAELFICNVKDCDKFKFGKVAKKDEHGLAGPRCMKHGAKPPRCNVEECVNFKWCKISAGDDEGPAGYRCRRHSSSNKTVNDNAAERRVENKKKV